jgi:hypothetical protein
VKYPLITGFCGGLLVFVACAYLGDRGAATIAYRELKPLTFESLKKQSDGQLRANLLTLQTVAFSQFVKDAQPDLEKVAEHLETERSTQSPELRPVLDLRIATCYVEVARLERDAGNVVAADLHLQMARDILHSLGWQNVSSETLASLIRGQLWWKERK